MPTANYSLRSASLVLLIFLAACAPKQLTPQASKPWIPRQALHSLAGFVEVDLVVRGRSESFQAALIAQSPNRLRIQILDELGREQALLVANGREVLWLNRREGIQKILPQDPEVLKKTLRLPMGLEEFVARLLEGNSPEQNPKSGSRYQILTEDLAETPQGPYPRQWTWNFRRPKAKLSFVFSQVKLNPILDPGKFDW